MKRNSENNIMKHYLNPKLWFLLFCIIRGTLQTLILEKETEIIKGKYLATMTIPKEYRISFEINFKSFLNVWTNAVHFANADDSGNGSYGSRISTITFPPNNGIAEIGGPVNENHRYTFNSKPFTLNTWYKIVVKQFFDNGTYFYVIEIDGETLHLVKNTNVKTFENVQLFVSDPWNAAQPGYVRNLDVPIEETSIFSLYREINLQNINTQKINEVKMSMSDVILMPLTAIFGADALVTYIDPSNEAYDADACIFTCLQNAKCYSLSFSKTGNVCMLYEVNVRTDQKLLSSKIDWDTYVL